VFNPLLSATPANNGVTMDQRMLKKQKPQQPLSPMRIVRAIQWRLLERRQPNNAYRGVYASFADAERNAPPIKPLGYDAAESTTWYLDRLSGVQFADYPAVYWLREAFADSQVMLEIGGHVGVAYYGFERILKYPADLSWTILDVPSVVKSGEALARERQRQNLRFITDLAAAPPAGILLAAGSLQYLEHTTLAPIIEKLPARPRHIIVNVTPVYEGPSFVTLQNIATAYCPYRVFNRADFVGALEKLGYQLVDTWPVPRPFTIPGHPDRAFETFSGFYFKLK
jgi:putative methyltransferase (TIGR04325 family)